MGQSGDGMPVACLTGRLSRRSFKIHRSVTFSALLTENATGRWIMNGQARPAAHQLRSGQQAGASVCPRRASSTPLVTPVSASVSWEQVWDLSLLGEPVGGPGRVAIL